MQFTPPFAHLSNASRIVFLMGLLILCGGLSIAISYLILVVIYGPIAIQDGLENINYLRIMQILNQVGIFIIPPMLFAMLTENKPLNYLGFRTPQLSHMVATMMVILSVGPVVGQLMTWNEAMELPAQWAGIEQWMKESEAAAKTIVEKMLAYTDIRSLAINIFMIVLLPAIGEELLFRATAIRLFNRIFNNTHVSVWVAAILFSAFHLQFFGFIPRMFLGLLFGYLYVWSGSIWVPFLAHLLNNGIVVIVAWLYASGFTSQTPDSIGATNSPLLLIGSLVTSVVLLLWFYRNRSLVLTT